MAAENVSDIVLRPPSDEHGTSISLFQAVVHPLSGGSEDLSPVALPKRRRRHVPPPSPTAADAPPLWPYSLDSALGAYTQYPGAPGHFLPLQRRDRLSTSPVPFLMRLTQIFFLVMVPSGGSKESDVRIPGP